MTTETLEAHGPICATDPCQRCIEAERRVRSALQLIQRAQAVVGEASSLISNIEGMAPQWSRLGKLYDRIHAEWYRVEDRRKRGRFTLDSIATDALRNRGDL